MPSTEKAFLQEITQDIISGNMKRYREELEQARPPFIPHVGKLILLLRFSQHAYLGVWLKDLTFIEDGNKDFIPGSKKVNWVKMVEHLLRRS